MSTDAANETPKPKRKRGPRKTPAVTPKQMREMQSIQWEYDPDDEGFIEKAKEPEGRFVSRIYAKRYISLSDLDYVRASLPSFRNASDVNLLWLLGLDTNQPYTQQENIWHRNLQNKIVFGMRYFGNERQDNEWLQSGSASREALDKHLNNRLLDDHYRERSATEDTQEVLESKDRYTVIDTGVQHGYP